MSKQLARQLMNSGSSRERQLGRLLARGRVRLDPTLQNAIDTADRVIKQLKKDGGGAGPGTGAPMVGADVHTDAVGSGKPRKTRLRLSYFK